MRNVCVCLTVQIMYVFALPTRSACASCGTFDLYTGQVCNVDELITSLLNEFVVFLRTSPVTAANASCHQTCYVVIDPTLVCPSIEVIQSIVNNPKTTISLTPDLKRFTFVFSACKQHLKYSLICIIWPCCLYALINQLICRMKSFKRQYIFFVSFVRCNYTRIY